MPIRSQTLKKTNPEVHVWLRTRKKILRQIKNRVNAHLDREPLELLKYRRAYDRSFERKFQLSSLKALVAQIRKTQVVFGGDFHAFSQAQRMHLKILRRYPDGQKVTIALEAAFEKQNPDIESYLRSEIGETEFLKKMQWNKNWGFPWENYRPLFELAKMRNYRVIGLSDSKKSSKVSLRARDRRAAEILVKESIENPQRKIYVLFGDLHIAPQHLPAEFKAIIKSLNQKIETLSIFLNPEKIYFKLATEGLENKIEIVKLSSNEFCVMGSPPWVQWQSYLMFLERSTDKMFSEQTSGEDIDFDPSDEVRTLVEVLSSDLKLKIQTNDLAVYSSFTENIWRGLQKHLNQKEIKIVHELVEDGRSIFFPQVGVGYLGRPSVNHAAELAGLYLHAKLSRRKIFFWNLPKDFEKQIWCEAMSFFTSKLINHKRYSHSLLDLSAKLKENNVQQEQEILKLALDHRMSEVLLIHQMKKRKRGFRPRRKTSYLFAARILGSMMGERLYIALQSNKIKIDEIVEFLKFNPERKDFLSFYLKILKWLEPVHLEMKSRRERL